MKHETRNLETVSLSREAVLASLNTIENANALSPLSNLSVF